MRLFLKFFIGLWLILLVAAVGSYYLSQLIVPASEVAERHIQLQKSLDIVVSQVASAGVPTATTDSVSSWLGESVDQSIDAVIRDEAGGIVFSTRKTLSKWAALQPTRWFRRALSTHHTVHDPDGRRFGVTVSTLLDRKSSVASLFVRPSIPITTFVVLVSILSALLGRYLFRPVDRLRRVAKLLADGHVGTRVGKWTSRRWDGFGALAQDFDRMTDRLEEDNREQQRIVREMSSELDMPVRHLRDALDRARAEPSTERLDDIEVEVDAIERMLNHGRTLTGNDNGRPVKQSESIELVELVADAVKSANELAVRESKHIYFRLATPLWTRGNPSLIREAIDNVLLSAMLYTRHDGTVEVEIRSESKPGGPRFVDIIVNDQGSTVPEDKLKVMFKSRIRSSDAEFDDERGRRLSIAERVVRLHDGSIIARNRVDGSGLRTIIRLNRAEHDGLSERLSSLD